MDTSPDIDPIVAKALEGAAPGRLVRYTGKVVRGAATTRDQIPSYADHWRVESIASLTAATPVLVVFGDSLGQGIGASSPDLGYVGLLRELLKEEAASEIAVLNLSRSGARIDDVLSLQLPAFAASGVRPFATVCTVGSNDLLRSVRLIKTSRKVRTLVEGLPAGAVLATVPAKGSMAAKLLNRLIKYEVGNQGVALADVGAALTSWRGHLARDGFHPNDRGYRIWSREFASALGYQLEAEPEPGSEPTKATMPDGPDEVE